MPKNMSLCKVPPRGFKYHPLNRDVGRKQKHARKHVSLGAPTGIRTPVVALKGLRPSPLDDGGRLFTERADFIIPSGSGQAICLLFLFGALTQKSQDVYLFAIDQNTRTFSLKIGN